MSAADFWSALARRWRTGAAICVLCILGAAAVSVAFKPLYQASALFHVSVLAPPGTITRKSDVILHLDVSVFQDWLKDRGVLQQAVNAAGARETVTPQALARSVAVLPAGTGGELEAPPGDASPPEFRRFMTEVAKLSLEDVTGIYQVSVRDTSPVRAQRLANAVAHLLGERATAVIKADMRSSEVNVLRALRAAEAVIASRKRDLDRDPASGNPAAHRLALARYEAALLVYRNLQAQLTGLQVLLTTGPATAGLLAAPGTPVAPVTPGRSLYLLFGLLTGAVAGVAAILVQEGARGADG